MFERDPWSVGGERHPQRGRLAMSSRAEEAGGPGVGS